MSLPTVLQNDKYAPINVLADFFLWDNTNEEEVLLSVSTHGMDRNFTEVGFDMVFGMIGVGQFGAPQNIEGMTSTTGNIRIFALPRLVKSFDYESGIDSTRSFGTMLINNMDGKLNDYLGHEWEGRSVIVRVGGVDDSIDGFDTVFTGKVKTVSWGLEHIKVVLDSSTEILDRKLQQNTYAGTGGLEGDDTIQDQRKPLVYGLVNNFKPVLVDPTNLVYQVHDGQLASAPAIVVRDNGVQLGFDSIGDVYNWNQVPGRFAVDYSNGVIRLGALPDGEVTVDVYGEREPGTVSASQTATEIVYRILDRAEFPETRINTTELDGLESKNNATLSVVLKDETVEEAIKTVLDSIDAWYRVDELGILRFGRHETPSSSTKTLTERTILSIDRIESQRPVKSVQIDYQPIAFVQTTLADSVSADHRQKVGKKNSQAIAKDIDSNFASAREVTKETGIEGRVDALFEASRILNRDLEIRHRYRITSFEDLFAIDPGDEFTVQVPYLGLDSGVLVVAQSVRNNVNDHIIEIEAIT